MDRRNDKAVRLFQEVSKAHQLCGLKRVVGFVMQLLACLVQIGRKRKPFWQQPRHVNQYAHISHITINAIRDARVLDFQCEIAPILELCPMNLTNRGGSNRVHVKLSK